MTCFGTTVTGNASQKCWLTSFSQLFSARQNVNVNQTRITCIGGVVTTLHVHVGHVYRISFVMLEREGVAKQI